MYATSVNALTRCRGRRHDDDGCPLINRTGPEPHARCLSIWIVRSAFVCLVCHSMRSSFPQFHSCEEGSRRGRAEEADERSRASARLSPTSEGQAQTPNARPRAAPHAPPHARTAPPPPDIGSLGRGHRGGGRAGPKRGRKRLGNPQPFQHAPNPNSTPHAPQTATDPPSTGATDGRIRRGDTFGQTSTGG